MNNVYKTKKNKITGSTFREINHAASATFDRIRKRTKRTPYIRSKYFKKEKIFLNIFWRHLYQKHEKDRTRRLKFYNCAIDLIENTTCHPTSKDNPNRGSELFHRFYGITKNGENFKVQIKEDKRTGRKDFISVFPPD